MLVTILFNASYLCLFAATFPAWPDVVEAIRIAYANIRPFGISTSQDIAALQAVKIERETSLDHEPKKNEPLSLVQKTRKQLTLLLGLVIAGLLPWMAFIGPDKGDDVLFDILLCIPVFLAVLLTVVVAVSVVYDFYKRSSPKKLFSFAYLEVLLLALALPSIFALFGAVAQDSDAMNYLDAALTGRAAPPFTIASNATPCDSFIASLGIKSPPPPKMDSTNFTDALNLWSQVAVDQYLKAQAYEAPDFFDCNFVRVRRNPDSVATSSVLFVYRVLVTFFALGVVALPIGKFAAFSFGLVSRVHRAEPQ